jgi:hypothetical protein
MLFISSLPFLYLVLINNVGVFGYAPCRALRHGSAVVGKTIGLKKISGHHHQ